MENRDGDERRKAERALLAEPEGTVRRRYELAVTMGGEVG